MKVYAVSHGSYSDYSIVAIFATRDLAAAAIESMKGGSSGWGDEQIEEWEIYDALPRKVRVYIKEENAGQVREFSTLYHGWDDPMHRYVGRVTRGLGFGKYAERERNYRFWGLDKARVAKAFDDYRGQRQAERAGVA